jgi:hypothetical protein
MLLLHLDVSHCCMYSQWIFYPITVQLRECCKYRAITNDACWSCIHIQYVHTIPSYLMGSLICPPRVLMFKFSDSIFVLFIETN